jgi:hypothetical protein
MLLLMAESVSDTTTSQIFRHAISMELADYRSIVLAWESFDMAIVADP